MFVQVMEGKVSDADAMRRQGERWEQELRPGAAGLLGTTGGLTAAGDSFVFARFDSEESARANSARPEQGQWWAETEQLYDGPVAFAESSEVDLFMGGGSDDAGFVQVMKGSGADRNALRELDDAIASDLAAVRPEILGGMRVWTGSDTYYQVVYFESEAAAREGEQREAPADLTALRERLQEAMAAVEFFDIADPILT